MPDLLFPIVTASCSMGTLVGQAVSFFGHVPAAGPGLRLRAMNIVVSRALLPDPMNYWKLQVGLWGVGTFQVLEELTLPGGVKTSGLRWEFRGVPRVPEGATIALRASPAGAPPALEGLSASLEYGITGQR